MKCPPRHAGRCWGCARASLVATGFLLLVAGPLDAIWLGGGGNWSQPTNWSVGVIPNNTPQTNYLVLIDNGHAVHSVVTQDVSVIINALDISAADQR
jgi:hypothetical protein